VVDTDLLDLDPLAYFEQVFYHELVEAYVMDVENCAKLAKSQQTSKERMLARGFATLIGTCLETELGAFVEENLKKYRERRNAQKPRSARSDPVLSNGRKRVTVSKSR